MLVSSATDTVCGDLALPSDDIFHDVSLDIRQAEIIDLYFKIIITTRLHT